jgi:phage terminase large subunit-like protein
MAIEEADNDWKEELRSIARVCQEALRENARWWDPYFLELNGFPDAKPSDWIASTSYGWQYLTRPGGAVFMNDDDRAIRRTH